MEALFIHGMGRTPLSGWPLLWKLRRAGLETSTFAYTVSVESFSRISDRLAAKVIQVAARTDYILIGHSLGGVLARAAVDSLPPDARRPSHVFLLGSPIRPSCLAQRLQRSATFRLLTRDCGRLLASAERMSAVGAMSVPVTSIVGTRGLAVTQHAFVGESNDGVVSVTEASAEWLADQVQIPCVHTLLPSSMRAATAILERVDRIHSPWG
jgi:pimeloyl-ACP methyl ester carboxylesterase